MRADNSRHLVAATQRRSATTRAKAVQAIRRLDATGQPVSVNAVANEAGVSRSWLYTQADLRAEIEQLRGRRRAPTSTKIPARQQASEASLLRRLELAHDRLRQLTAENQSLRQQLAVLLGERRATAPAGSRIPSTVRSGEETESCPSLRR